MKTAWEACDGTQVIIESPVSMAGFHIAEKLNVPYFATFTMPWTRTSQFPHPFAVTDVNLGAGYNSMTWALMEQVYWTGIQPIINRFRKNILDLPPAVGSFYDDAKSPFIYNFSPSVVEPPSDWKDYIHLCGYWFLDNPDRDWTPPADVLEFLEGTEETKHLPIVYIGFGSIIVPDPDQLTLTIVKAVEKAGVRAFVSKGWSSRSKDDSGNIEPTSLTKSTPTVFYLDSIPHDWLFPRIDAVVHHGGAGTTAAGLRSGLPTLIKPFFGDQYFWASRLHDLGVGTSIKKLEVEALKNGLIIITRDEKIIRKAKALGEKIRKEDGVANAISCIHRNIELAKHHSAENTMQKSPPPLNKLGSIPRFSSGKNLSSKDSSPSPVPDRSKFSFRQLTSRKSLPNVINDGYLSDTTVSYSRRPTATGFESTGATNLTVANDAKSPKPNKLRKKALSTNRLRSSPDILNDSFSAVNRGVSQLSLLSDLHLAGPADVPGLSASSSAVALETPLDIDALIIPPQRTAFQKKHRYNQSDSAAFLTIHQRNSAGNNTVASDAASARPPRRSVFRFWNRESSTN